MSGLRGGLSWNVLYSKNRYSDEEKEKTKRERMIQRKLTERFKRQHTNRRSTQIDRQMICVDDGDIEMRIDWQLH